MALHSLPHKNKPTLEALERQQITSSIRFFSHMNAFYIDIDIDIIWNMFVEIEIPMDIFRFEKVYYATH